MKIVVGGRELITSATLQVPGGEDAILEFLAGSWNLRVTVRFKEDKENATQRYEFVGDGQAGILTFVNWNSMTGAMQAPALIGETSGRKVSFIASGFAVEQFKFVNLSFFWEK